MPIFNLIFKATLKLSVQVSIDTHVEPGLIEALQGEKNKRKRGKKMDLCEEAPSAVLYPPDKIYHARKF
jgi:hypothetical protein